MRKMNVARLILLVLILVIIFGCAALTKHGQLESSARQHYSKGRYDQAVFDCASALKLKPEYDKAQMLIQDAFKAGINSHENKIKELKASTEKFKWDKIVSEYEALVRLNQVITELPVLQNKKTQAIIKFDARDYSNELSNSKMQAAEIHYQHGLELSKNENVDVQKQAAKEFKTATSFITDYKDAATLYQKARKGGIKRLAIIPFEDNSGKGGIYGDLSGMIVDDVVTDVMTDKSAMEFLELISRDQLERVMEEQKLGLTGLINEETAVELGKVLGVHEILTGKITQIIHIPEKTIRKNVKKKANVVVRKEEYKDSKGKTKTRNIRGDVFANVTVHTKTAGGKITGSYNIIDVTTAKLKKSEIFTGKYDFKYEWATYTGDERALDSHSKKLASKSEIRAPVAEELIHNAAKNLSQSLTKALKSYVK